MWQIWSCNMVNNWTKIISKNWLEQGFNSDILLQIKYKQICIYYGLIEINLECSKIWSDYIVN